MLSRPEHEYTIVTPFGGQPFEEPHRSKYLILHDEHQRVCEFAGWDFINGSMGDDAARPFPWNDDDSEWLVEWLTETLVDNILMEISPVFNDSYPLIIRELFQRGFTAEVCNPYQQFTHDEIDAVVAQAPQVDMMFRRVRA